MFASRLKRRLRQGARLIVIDSAPHRAGASPHIKADFHLQVRPGTNTALLSSMAHVIATEGLIDEAYVAERCEAKAFQEWRDFVSLPENSPEAMAEITGVPAQAVRGAARLFATGGNGSIYYGLGDRAQPGFHHRHGHRQPGHGHRQRRPRRRGRELLRGQPEQRAGLVRHGPVPARAAGLPPYFDNGAAQFEQTGA